MMKITNWKTTLMGIGSLAATVTKIIAAGVVETSDVGAIVAGVGLILAKDGDVTGGARKAR